MKTKTSKPEITFEKVFKELENFEQHIKNAQTENRIAEQNAISILNHLRDMKQLLRSKR